MYYIRPSYSIVELLSTPVPTVRVMGRVDVLKTEGLVLQAMLVSHMRMSCKTELPIVSICSI